ncbi:MAG TPA: molybdopterin cofactor-binding domain-containing protein, partial [Gammaproteobacteria bacterium]|nr:molybdopterin cofactor-binding domain-containing protein [Gammaproteobacteria bacterium]
MSATPTKTTRRTFLKGTALASGGLLLGFRLPTGGRYAEAAEVAPGEAEFEPNAWVRISSDDQVTVIVGRSEMGQGVMTAIPMLVAEELEADWERIAAEFAPAHEAYTNALLGRQATGGSTAIRAAWRPLREAGAAAKEMLLAAAAQRWGVNASECRVENQTVVHKGSGGSATFGDLAAEAAEQPVPEAVFLKQAKNFRLLGTPRDRLDSPAKVDGSARFGMDVQLDGLLTAQVVRCPVFGGQVRQFDDRDALKVPGVKQVVAVSAGVAVIAEGFWPAQKGREALQVEWDYGDHAGLSSSAIERQFREAADAGDAAVARSEGDAAGALDNAATTVEAEYEVPFLAHACMEPMNATARIEGGVCEVWAPTQDQTTAQQKAMEISGLPKDKVQVHTTYLGGGFGRRSHPDFVVDAVECAKAADAPVKVVWTREDTTRHDRFRPATFNRLSAAVDGDGGVTAWRHRIAGPSIMANNGMLGSDQQIDASSVEGAENVPYGLANIQVDYAMANTPVPLWWWRSVGSSQNGFIREAFFDEVAAAAGEDPYELRRR